MARVVRMRRFGEVLRQRISADADKARRAAFETMKRAEFEAVEETLRQGVFDIGHYHNAWTVIPIPNGWQVRNTAPYASVIEFGRRPGRPGPPIAPIREWVKRQLVGNGVIPAKDADRVAFLVRRKLHEKGTEPKPIFRTVATRLPEWFKEELRKRLKTR